MTLFWLTVTLLILAAGGVLLTALRRDAASLTTHRDELNKRFYHQRLKELEEDESLGVIGERSAMVQELQQALLSDIPARAQQAPPARALSGWLLLPGMLVVIVVSVGLYLKTGSLMPVTQWIQVKQALPSLRARIMDPAADAPDRMQLSQLALGVRSELQEDPQNLNDWMLLGRLGVVLDNADTAIQSFRHAFALAPNDAEVKLSYAQALTRSGDPQDNQQAGDMLQQMLNAEPSNLSVLNLLAFNAWTRQQYGQAIDIWQQMLKILPPDDRRVDLIKRSIEQAKSESGKQTRSLALTITLTPQAKKDLPQNGVLLLAVLDGVSMVPVAVKKLPLSHFPLSLTMDDSDAVVPDRLLSAQHRIRVQAWLSHDGSPSLKTGEWFGQSEEVVFDGRQHLAVEINRQQP